MVKFLNLALSGLPLVLSQSPTQFYGSTCGVAIAPGARSNLRVVGGTKYGIKDHPWNVQLNFGNSEETKYDSVCGGSVISEHWILTVAHCTKDMNPDFSRAIIGKTNVNWDLIGDTAADHAIESLHAHPDFNDATTNNDVGLVKTLDEIRFSNMIQPVCLPMNEMCLNDQTMVTITGWGSTLKDGSDTPLGMRGAQIPVVTSRRCAFMYNDQFIADTMTCAGDGYNADGCDGDSGSPLTFRNENDDVYTLWAMNSWSNMPCASGGYPGVYVRVSNFLQWVKDTSGVYPAGDMSAMGTQCDDTFDYGLFGTSGLTLPVIEGTTAAMTEETMESLTTGYMDEMTTETEVMATEMQVETEGATTDAPTDAPTEAPTEAPTDAPTDATTDAPTEEPTEEPTEAPTDAPTDAPTNAPTNPATDAPTDAPLAETNAPTNAPTNSPTTIAPEATFAVSEPNFTNHTNSLTSSPLSNPSDVLRDLLEQIFMSYGVNSVGFTNSNTRKKRQANNFDDVLSAIQDHGCWCSKPLLGYASGGVPLDQTDSVCRQWAQCTHCEKLSECTGSLSDSFVLQWTPSSNAYTCTSTSECAQTRCECNAYFAISMANYLDSNGAFIDASNSNVDPSVCVKNGNGVSNDACCGDAPDWKPYSSASQTCTSGVLL